MTSLQEKSETYWKWAVNSHLATPDFYERKRQSLLQMIGSLPEMEAGLDIGCGNGEYTSLLAQTVKKTIGYDISPALLDAARQNFANEQRLEFREGSVDDLPAPEKAFDIVLCMGVTSCIIDDSKYLNLLRNISLHVRDGGYVIMGDTLSVSQNLLLNDNSGYVAKYRDIAAYKQNLFREGLVLLNEEKLMQGHGGKTANLLMLFTKSPPKPQAP